MKKPSTLARPASPPSPANKHLGRRERRAAETRERLFRAALRLFEERGFSATTVEDITEAADVGKGTFFNYFPSKEHIIAAFGQLQLGKLQAAVAAAQSGDLPTRQLLHRLANALAEEPGRSPSLVRSILLANLSSGPVRQLLQQNLERGRTLLGELFAVVQQRGEIRRDLQASELARAFQQVFFGALLMWSLDPREPLTARFNSVFPILWSGIEAESSNPGKEKLS